MAETLKAILPPLEVTIPDSEQARAEFRECFPDVTPASDLGVRIRRVIAERLRREKQYEELAGGGK
jgi:hypothetical protein